MRKVTQVSPKQRDPMLIAKGYKAFMQLVRSQQVSDKQASVPQTALTEADSKKTAEVSVLGYALKPNKADE